MELNKIKELTYKWESTTWKIIDFQDIDRSKLQQLFKETYELLDEYLLEELVPKEICNLLLEMYDFGWWVSDLNETPLHNLYQDISSLVFEIRKFFLTDDANVDKIQVLINENLKNKNRTH